MANISDGKGRREGLTAFPRTFLFEMEVIPVPRRGLTKMAHCCVEKS